MAHASVDLLIFDLDGTLIESKWDIAKSVNLTLGELGLPLRTEAEIFSFVGDGVKRLLRLSVGEGRLDRYEEALRIFRGHYLSHCLDCTTFYPGVERVLTHFARTHKAVATNCSACSV
jgi:phosphoglycolate phosphatase